MLKFDNICKTFNPGTPDAAVVFQNFNLELEKGEFLAIVGSNGSGKTTLLNILCGSIPADGGRILLAGEDITGQKGARVSGPFPGHLPEPDGAGKHGAGRPQGKGLWPFLGRG